MFEINDLNVSRAVPSPPPTTKMGTHDIVVGYDIVDNLLPNQDPSARKFASMAEVYTVTALGSARAKSSARVKTNYVDMPLSTYLHTHGEHQSLNISAKAGMVPGALDNLIDEVRALCAPAATMRSAPTTTSPSSPMTPSSACSTNHRHVAGIIIGIAAISLVSAV